LLKPLREKLLICEQYAPICVAVTTVSTRLGSPSSSAGRPGTGHKDTARAGAEEDKNMRHSLGPLASP
jgi:hypothetical protein